MRKVSLRKSSGFGLAHVGGSIEFNEVSYSKTKKFGFDEIKPQLLNDHLQNVGVFYTKYYNLDVNDVFKKKNIKIDLTVLPPDVVGIEYIKTKAIRCSQYNKILEIVNGAGIVVIQKFLSVDDQEILISNVKSTDKIIIPAGYTYTLINDKSTILIALEFMNSKAKNNITLDEMKGMAYYIIKKNAKKEIVKNPSYRIVDKYKKFDWKSYYKKYNITPKTPLSRQLLRKPEKFNWFFKPAKDSNNNIII
jgi:oxalate decarboxylase/phosphoglucose isomerase-like protein (cupin superfamily)